MSGIAHFHYPQIIWRDGEKRLWNPIHRKALKNRPEERVRLRIIEALVEAGWSKHRISTEEQLRPVDSPGGRTDIICYDQDFNPKILVECKAESVSITPTVAEQTARYNRTVEAPYLLMTNGHTDFWYQLDGQSTPEQLSAIPELLSIPSEKQNQDFSYWQERGFAGEKATDTGLRNWLTSVLHTFWKDQSEQIRFIEFNSSPSDLSLHHYFHISQLDDHRVALGILSTPFGGTRLVGVINRQDQNVGLIEVNLDLLAAGTLPNATVYSAGKPINFDIREQTPIELTSTTEEEIQRIPAFLNAAFDALAE